MGFRGISALELLRGSAKHAFFQSGRSIRVQRLHQPSPQYPNTAAMTCRRAVLRVENNDGSGEIYLLDTVTQLPTNCRRG
jgi:hypothetical protein